VGAVHTVALGHHPLANMHLRKSQIDNLLLIGVSREWYTEVRLEPQAQWHFWIFSAE